VCSADQLNSDLWSYSNYDRRGLDDYDELLLERDEELWSREYDTDGLWEREYYGNFLVEREAFDDLD
jgi:hypothetical protein